MSGTTDIWSAAIQAVGTIGAATVAGFFAGSIAQRYQRRRALIDVRRELSGDMSSTVAEFLVISRQYHRISSPSAADTEGLSKVYADTRVQTDSIETKLKVFFGEAGGKDSVYALWHTCSDLLTVRYLALLQQLDTETISLNADPQGSTKSEPQRPHTRWSTERLEKLRTENTRRESIISLGRDAETYCDRAVAKVLTQRIEDIFPKDPPFRPSNRGVGARIIGPGQNRFR